VARARCAKALVTGTGVIFWNSLTLAGLGAKALAIRVVRSTLRRPRSWDSSAPAQTNFLRMVAVVSRPSRCSSRLASGLPIIATTVVGSLWVGGRDEHSTMWIVLGATSALCFAMKLWPPRTEACSRTNDCNGSMRDPIAFECIGRAEGWCEDHIVSITVWLAWASPRCTVREGPSRRGRRRGGIRRTGVPPAPRLEWATAGECGLAKDAMPRKPLVFGAFARSGTTVHTGKRHKLTLS